MSAPPIKLEGVFPILATPFGDDERLDLDSLTKLIRFMARIGVDGVTVLGVLGEANRMADHERERVIRASVTAAAGEIPVCVGATHTGTAGCVELCGMAAQAGAAAVMVAPPPQTDEPRILEFYRRVGEAIPIPLIVQDHPASSQVQMSTALLLRIAAEVPRVACIKEEAPPTPAKVGALLDGLDGRRVTLLQGLGALYAMFDLERGAHGFMTGFAFPEVLLALLAAVRAEDPERAWAIYRRYLPLIVFEQQPGAAIRKEALRLRGLIAGNRVRHPGANIDAATAAQLARLLARTFPGVDISAPVPVEP